MNETCIVVDRSGSLNGTLELAGAKNAVLVIMASLILTHGKSILKNVPCSDDVLHMIELLTSLGAHIIFHKDEELLEVDTAAVNNWCVSPDSMRKMRASILVTGPLLARFGKAIVALPGGCLIGARPIDYHLKSFVHMGADIVHEGEFVTVTVNQLKSVRIVLEYPSVGATENSMMAAVHSRGITTIVNASLEPEVLDLIDYLFPISHEVIVDRLEAGALLLAAAVTGGSISLPSAYAYSMDVFLMKLEEMGHHITIGPNGNGITLVATHEPKAVSFKTAPYPGFPTDLQAPMMAAQCIAQGSCTTKNGCAYFNRT
jgi:UDP-N-acetylglucosamine 1-carboxyvinyltransferase